jgi:hypothetical protein
MSESGSLWRARRGKRTVVGSVGVLPLDASDRLAQGMAIRAVHSICSVRMSHSRLCLDRPLCSMGDAGVGADAGLGSSRDICPLRDSVLGMPTLSSQPRHSLPSPSSRSRLPSVEVLGDVLVDLIDGFRVLSKLV